MIPLRRALLFLCVWVGIVGLSGDAWAHTRSASWSSWSVAGNEVTARVRIARYDLSALSGFSRIAAAAGGETPSSEDERVLMTYLQQRLRVSGAGEPCPVTPSSYSVLHSEDGYISRGWTSACRSVASLEVTSSLFAAEIPSHLHFAALTEDGGATASRLLTRDAPSWAMVSLEPGPSSRLVDFVALGFRHVLTGADHLVFVFTLLLAASSLREMAGAITGFTLGHSLTLALATLGSIHPDSFAVEALVGASIAIVAAENVWLERKDAGILHGAVVALGLVSLLSALTGRGSPLALFGLALFVASYFGYLRRMERPSRLRWAVAALFGTVHGLAFSGALGELHLPRAALATALFGFNGGVELAQLALVALAWPLWRWVASSDKRSSAVVFSSSVAAAAGSFWLIERSFG